MKKFEMLEKAMRDYPKGTLLISPSSGTKHESSGVFKIDTTGGVADLESGYMVYSVRSGGHWGEIVTDEKPKEITLHEDTGIPVKILKTHIDFYENGTGVIIRTKSHELVEIYEAWKSLQD